MAENRPYCRTIQCDLPLIEGNINAAAEDGYVLHSIIPYGMLGCIIVMVQPAASHDVSRHDIVTAIYDHLNTTQSEIRQR